MLDHQLVWLYPTFRSLEKRFYDYYLLHLILVLQHYYN